VAFYFPFEVDPSSAGVLYLGTHQLYRTANRGDLWAPISGDLTKGGGYITAIGVAPSDRQTLYVGAVGRECAGNAHHRRELDEHHQGAVAQPLGNRSRRRPAERTGGLRDLQRLQLRTTPTRAGHVFRTTNAGASCRTSAATCRTCRP